MHACSCSWGLGCLGTWLQFPVVPIFAPSITFIKYRLLCRENSPPSSLSRPQTLLLIKQSADVHQGKMYQQTVHPAKGSCLVLAPPSVSVEGSREEGALPQD